MNLGEALLELDRSSRERQADWRELLTAITIVTGAMTRNTRDNTAIMVDGRKYRVETRDNKRALLMDGGLLGLHDGRSPPFATMQDHVIFASQAHKVMRELAKHDAGTSSWLKAATKKVKDVIATSLADRS